MANVSSQLPILDFVAYMASTCGIDLTTIRSLSRENAYAAILIENPALHGVARTLGVLGRFFMEHRSDGPVLDDWQAIDCIRVGAYCADLPAGDSRRIVLDRERAKALVDTLRATSAALSTGDDALLARLDRFAPTHPLRRSTLLAARIADESAYIEYWIGRADDQVQQQLKNERFAAGLEAMGQERLSFHGFLEKVYGAEYYDRVLTPRHFALFDSLESSLTARVVATLAARVRDGRLLVPPDLIRRYPDIYEFYQPEHYGTRPRSD